MDILEHLLIHQCSLSASNLSEVTNTLRLKQRLSGMLKQLALQVFLRILLVDLDCLSNTRVEWFSIRAFILPVFDEVSLVPE